MGRYILQRILLIVPTLLVVSFLAFWISLQSPQDPMEALYVEMLGGRNKEQIDREVEDLVKTFKLDRPAFYISLQPYSSPGTFHQIVSRRERKTVQRLFYRYGHWEMVNLYQSSLAQLLEELQLLQEAHPNSSEKLQAGIQACRLWQNMDMLEDSLIDRFSQDISAAFGSINGEANTSEYDGSINLALETSKKLSLLTPEWQFYLPRIRWHGLDNRYHHWLSGVISRGDFGQSMSKGTQANKDWAVFVGMTLRFTLIAVLISYALAIFLAGWLVSREGQWQQKWVDRLLLALDGIPSFWMATLLLLVFAHNNILPASYDQFARDGWTEAKSMIMPLLTYVLGMMVVLTRLLKSSLSGILDNEDYIRTARAKGLSPSRIVWVHALRNALIPLVASLASIFVFLLSGSVVVEFIFDIPGMGQTILDALKTNDILVITMIFTFTGLFTAIGYLLTDILYVLVDPRIRIQQNNR